MWHIIMFVFTEFRNNSIQLNLVPFDWLMYSELTAYIIIEPLFEMCFFLLLVSKSQLIVISLLKYLSSE